MVALGMPPAWFLCLDMEALGQLPAWFLSLYLHMSALEVLPAPGVLPALYLALHLDVEALLMQETPGKCLEMQKCKGDLPGGAVCLNPGLGPG